MAADILQDFDTTFKVLVLGDSSVGKTCMIYRFCDGVFHESYLTTIGIDCREKIVNIDDSKVRLRLWDTAGQERFRTLTTSYYRGAMGILLVYDVTNPDSFYHMNIWLKNVDEMAPEGSARMIIGNKCDKEWARQVQPDQGKNLAAEFGLEFMETSSKTGQNIDEAFLTLSRKIEESRQRLASRMAGIHRLPHWKDTDDNRKSRKTWCSC